MIFFPIAEGGAKIFGVFRVKNHNFTPKNDIFSNFRGPTGSAPAYGNIYKNNGNLKGCTESRTYMTE
jgi:hypothetical protein